MFFVIFLEVTCISCICVTYIHVCVVNVKPVYIAGNFGSVFKGYLTLEDEKEETLVAVKTLPSKYQ